MKLGCDLNLIVTARLFEKDYVLMFLGRNSPKQNFSSFMKAILYESFVFLTLNGQIGPSMRFFKFCGNLINIQGQ